MSDELTTAGSVIAHASGGIGAGGLGAWLMHFLKNKQEAEERKEQKQKDEERAKRDQEIAVALSQLVAKVDSIAKAQEKHDGFGERLALIEQSVKTAHARIDAYQQPRRKR